MIQQEFLESYKYSGSSNINDVAWYEDNSGCKTHSVGTKQSNELEIYNYSPDYGNYYYGFRLVLVP